MPGIVHRTAGADKGLLVSDGACSPQSPTPTPTPGEPTPTPTPTEPTPGPTQPSGTNLSIGAGSDGSGKADGTSYGNVRDGDPGTYWSPTGPTGSISIKWGTPTAVSVINIREASGAAGNIGGWRVVDADAGTVLASGNGAGVITFPRATLRKITFEVTSSTGTPRIAEYETYAG